MNSIESVKSVYRCTHYMRAATHPKCWERYIAKYKGARIGFLDIESSNLDADFGVILSWSIKEEGEGIISGTIEDDRDDGVLDKEVVGELVAVMSRFDVLVTYYGSRFDIPFIRSRAMVHGLDFPPAGSLVHIDLWEVARRKLKIHSNRLETVCQFLGIKGKTALEPSVWIAARHGGGETRRRAIKEILRHNRGDVVILEKAYKRLLPYFRVRGGSI